MALSLWVQWNVGTRKFVGSDMCHALNHKALERKQLVDTLLADGLLLNSQFGTWEIILHQHSEPQHREGDGPGVLGKEKIKFVVLSPLGFQCRGNAKLRANRQPWNPLQPGLGVREETARLGTS